MSIYASRKRHRKSHTTSCDEELEAGTLETVLGIHNDPNLNFEDHIKTLRSKAAKN